ncbi:hypothetical protein OSB04_001870 [Centaurea solstitialis]|uniref:Uncharacterized protein n=1 Tax=Centaurea solstitialis TaxID=347529 RepID=A0AA38TS64_9ASTR|nr:hypothetical protein OSB04_001870 [Centaurea solstitialis]
MPRFLPSKIFGRYNILMGLLTSDVIGFQTLDYARHFLACYGQMLGSKYELKRGYFLLDYYGRRSLDVDKIEAEIRLSCKKINRDIGSLGYELIVLIDQPISLCEWATYFAILKAAIVTPLRNGMNLMTYNGTSTSYAGARQAGDDTNIEPLKTSMVVGITDQSPWDVRATATATNAAISASEDRKQTGHVKHYRHITGNDIAN